MPALHRSTVQSMPSLSVSVLSVRTTTVPVEQAERRQSPSTGSVRAISDAGLEQTPDVHRSRVQGLASSQSMPERHSGAAVSVVSTVVSVEVSLTVVSLVSPAVSSKVVSVVSVEVSSALVSAEPSVSLEVSAPEPSVSFEASAEPSTSRMEVSLGPVSVLPPPPPPPLPPRPPRATTSVVQAASTTSASAQITRRVEG